MRVISFILALFLFGTIFIPCTDSDENQIVKTELITDATQDSDIHFDFCSPLCSCHCCHSHVVTTMLSFDFNDYPVQQVYSNRPVSIMDQAFPFWQPPKIS